MLEPFNVLRRKAASPGSLPVTEGASFMISLRQDQGVLRRPGHPDRIAAPVDGRRAALVLDIDRTLPRPRRFHEHMAGVAVIGNVADPSRALDQPRIGGLGGRELELFGAHRYGD